MNAVVEFPTLADPALLTQASVDYDAATATMYWWMKPAPRPCFNEVMLKESMLFEGRIEQHGGWFMFDGRESPIRNAVFGSAIPGVFNLGGDLAMFVQAILRKDRNALRVYGNACVDNMHRRIVGYNAHVMTYSLVQGKAFGGGFECALASDTIVAEESATFSFPEVLFNMFPGMGAVSLLSRKIGMRRAEEIVMSGKVYTAQEMFELGVVDEVAADESGLEAIRYVIKSRQRKHNAFMAMARAKREVQPISHAEMRNVVDIWVDAALALENRDLRMMARLARAQDKMNIDQCDGVQITDGYSFELVDAANC